MPGGLPIFRHLCDWALIEELKHRRGEAVVAAALKVEMGTIYSWRSRGKARGLDREKRDSLLAALDATVGENPADRELATLQRIEARLADLSGRAAEPPPERPRAAPSPGPRGGAQTRPPGSARGAR